MSVRVFAEDQFDLSFELGKGAFGVVYKARDLVEDRDVAIKQVDLESSEEIREIQQEIAILASSNHENITRYYGSFLKGYKLWIVMEFLGGGSCADLLAAGPFDETVISLLCHDLLLALVYLHESGKIHRDIKAANVLLSEQGEVKIGDFGVATQLSGNLSRRNTFVGTPYWMPPEVILHKDYNYKADIWSLGITAMEFAYGRPPLSEFHPFDVLFKIADQPPPSPGSDFSSDFRAFVALCLQKDPKERPNAKTLLKHPFIKAWKHINRSVLTKLIDKKMKWDIETGNTNKVYYVPSRSQKTVDPKTPASDVFDLGTVTVRERDDTTLRAISNNQMRPKRASDAPESGLLLKKASTVSVEETVSVIEDRERKNRLKLNSMLNHAFDDTTSTLNLNTHQYDTLVKFQSSLITSSFIDPEMKQIFPTFFRHFLNRLMLSDTESLKKMLLPSHYNEMETLAATSRKKMQKVLPRDEIEELLFGRWAESALERWPAAENE
ncbi:unnamed protein product [Kuraishia capsulata CBS 1993]|uniref:non-specific serine/threonine protein kinase n=1 Tax=Kuraishia capsulata CBS 1993 TaxID=1382522 RepID=W6MWD1_9ASCO|nr:uncharacterized protein KUCA_T00003213001 [Kuraishia capsulata CBS 1993]CDK27235.1 unnamed protein product [Kuraishia capsulata CBS 1993]